METTVSVSAVLYMNVTAGNATAAAEVSCVAEADSTSGVDPVETAPVVQVSCVAEAETTAQGTPPKTTELSEGVAVEKPEASNVTRRPPPRLPSEGETEVTDSGTVRALGRQPTP